jgi:hypothetical protein
MSFVLSYPVTRYKPSPIVDLCTKAERERLSPPAIKAFFKIRRDQIRMRVQDSADKTWSKTGRPTRAPINSTAQLPDN